MLGSIFLRVAVENVRTHLRDKCDLSVVKPGAGLNEVTQSVNNEISTLTPMDVLILGDGPKDLDKCKAKTAFCDV
jgi:hypothetical protein